MGLLFNGTTSIIRDTVNPPITGAVCTIAAWLWQDTWGAGGSTHAISFHGASSQQINVMSTTGAHSRFFVQGTGSMSGNGAATLVAKSWHHFALSVSSVAAGSGFVDGADKVALSGGTGTLAPTELQFGGSGGTPNWPGIIAEPCIWNVALTDAEIKLLALGQDPLTIRPGSIVYYSPFLMPGDGRVNLRNGKPSATSYTAVQAAPHAPAALGLYRGRNIIKMSPRFDMGGGDTLSFPRLKPPSSNVIYRM